MRVKHVILLVVTGLMIAFIFVQSALPPSFSKTESIEVMNRIVNPFLTSFGFEPISHETVRKLAHVLEFLILAVLLVFCWKGNLLRSGHTGFTVAFLDETVQLFSGRGAMILDLWIDLIGIAAGTLIGYLLRKGIQRHLSEQQKSADA